MSEADLGGAALAWLLMIGVLSGAASVWALRNWSNPVRFREEMNRVIAHLMEFRLFAEEPTLIIRAQWNLLRANARMLRVLLAPSLLLLIPFVLLFSAMEGFFARAALPIGEAAVITLQGRGNLRAAQLQTPREIAVETPAVSAPRLHQVSWRVRPLEAVRGSLQVQWDGHLLRKSIAAGAGLHWTAAQRSGSLAGFVAHPFEIPFADSEADWVRVEYPAASVAGVSWLVWYSVAALLGGLLPLQRTSHV